MRQARLDLLAASGGLQRLKISNSLGNGSGARARQRRVTGHAGRPSALPRLASSRGANFRALGRAVADVN